MPAPPRSRPVGRAEIKVVTSTGPGDYTISGIVRLGGSNSLLRRHSRAIRSAHRTEAVRPRGRVRRDLRQGGRRVSPDPARRRASPPRCRRGYQAITAASAAAEQQDQVSQGPRVPSHLLLDLGFVALFVGAFIIFNTFNHRGRPAQSRAGAVPGARCAPATGACLVMVESAIVGFIASLGGILLGMALAQRASRPCFRARAAAADRRRWSSPPHDHRVDRARHRHHHGGRLPAGAAGRAVGAAGGAARSRAPSGSIRRRVIVGSLIAVAGIAAIGARTVRQCVERWARRRPRRRAHLPRGRRCCRRCSPSRSRRVIGRPLRGKIAGTVGRRKRQPEPSADRLHGGGPDDRARSGRVRLGVRRLAEGIGDRRRSIRCSAPTSRCPRTSCAVLAPAGEGSLARPPLLHHVGRCGGPRRTQELWDTFLHGHGPGHDHLRS